MCVCVCVCVCVYVCVCLCIYIYTSTSTHKQGVSSRGQPVCSALLLGPTGVGKTELSKVVARELFDDEKHIVRIDMRSHLFF